MRTYLQCGIEIDDDQAAGEVLWHHYISTPDGTIADLVTDGTVGGTVTPYYFLYDHLGSVYAVCNGSGSIATFNNEAQIYNFDPWGRRRNYSDWSYQNVPAAFITDRGFTSHEHLLQFDLINMNGRVYDPRSALFLSPDPYIQNPSSTLSHNRYSYCFNNPLKYTDPSGYWAGWDDLIVGGIGFGFGYVSHGLSTGDWGWSAVGQGALSAGMFLMGYYSGGISSAGSIASAYSSAGLYGHAATVALGYSAGMVASGAISSMMPSATIDIGDFSFGLSPAFLYGSGAYTAGFNFQARYRVGDFSLGGAYGGSYGKSGFTGSTGTELRVSGYVGYDNGRFGAGLSTTQFFSGETSQRLGRVALRYGDFSMSYENDGTPFQHIGLGGGTDSYRTASVTLGFRDLTIGMLLFSGHRDYRNEIRQEGYPYKMVGNPEINRYNAGILYAGYGDMRIGYNHDNIRHVFQNRFAHGVIQQQAWIPRKSWPNEPYFVKGVNNPYTNW